MNGVFTDHQIYGPVFFQPKLTIKAINPILSQFHRILLLQLGQNDIGLQGRFDLISGHHIFGLHCTVLVFFLRCKVVYPPPPPFDTHISHDRSRVNVNSLNTIGIFVLTRIDGSRAKIACESDLSRIEAFRRFLNDLLLLYLPE